jgi:RNA polymerase sigma-70 factor (ECF subfamily)
VTAATTTEAAATTSALETTPAKAVGKEVGRLFSAHGRMVFALCNVLLRDRPEAEDATQQCFLSAQKSMLAGVVPADPAAWLAAIARNECLSRLRRRRPETVALRDDDLVGGDDLADVVDRRIEIEALSAAIAGLPPAQRQAVVLRDFYGLSYREVSVALGVTGPAVESLLFKSRKRLQKRLRPLRAAGGIAAVPASIRDALIRKIPGFSSGLPGGAGVTAKLLTGHAAAKLAALALVAGAGTAVLATERGGHSQAAPAPRPVLRMSDFPVAAPVHDLQVHPTEIFTRIPPHPKVVRQQPAPTPVPASVVHAVPTPSVVHVVPPSVPSPAPPRVVRLPVHIAVTLTLSVDPALRGKEPDDPPLPETPSAPQAPIVVPPPTTDDQGGGTPAPSSDASSPVTPPDNVDAATTPTTTASTTTTATTTTTSDDTSNDGGGGGDHRDGGTSHGGGD